MCRPFVGLKQFESSFKVVVAFAKIIKKLNLLWLNCEYCKQHNNKSNWFFLSLIGLVNNKVDGNDCVKIQSLATTKKILISGNKNPFGRGLFSIISCETNCKEKLAFYTSLNKKTPVQKRAGVLHHNQEATLKPRKG